VRLIVGFQQPIFCSKKENSVKETTVSVIDLGDTYHFIAGVNPSEDGVMIDAREARFKRWLQDLVGELSNALHDHGLYARLVFDGSDEHLELVVIEKENDS
jgi:hypothetical protein